MCSTTRNTRGETIGGLSTRACRAVALQTYDMISPYSNPFCYRYYCFVTECKNPKACTILLRGASKDILNEVIIQCLSEFFADVSVFTFCDSNKCELPSISL